MKAFPVFLFCLLNLCHGYKILGIFHSISKSHFLVGSSLMKGLAEKGHEVTILSPYTINEHIANYHEIRTPTVVETNLRTNIVVTGPNTLVTSLKRIIQLYITSGEITNLTIHDPAVKALINSSVKFDLVILCVASNEALLGFGHHFNAPIVAMSPFGASMWTCDLVGSPAPLSYVPYSFNSLTDHMTFYERLTNVILTTFDRIYYTTVFLPSQEKLYNGLFPDPKPSLYELRQNVSLVLLNTHFSLSYPRPYMPNMIEVGGIQINRNVDKLPKDIQEYLDNAHNGVIYFSLGTNLKCASIPEEIRAGIIRVFASLKERVLWKCELMELPSTSENILIRNWFPQNEILAHNNTKLFISHGGLLSTTEAIYHAVPVIGVPRFFDQFLNIALCVKAGFAIQLTFNELHEEHLRKTIREILDNPKYANQVKAMSQRYRDQPHTPLETATFWIEYVIRHKGAPHLRSRAVDLNFVEYHNIDTFGVLVIMLLLSLFVVHFIFKKIGKILCAIFKSRNIEKKKQ